ncbi:hypothetical protein NVP1208B_19 [Vibrio phage 1.208.B._10N.222.52.A7]|nr:hypothetical protein NVP1208B_19 [Vibrio phage 1.208.B._10N.222.52.A7]
MTIPVEDLDIASLQVLEAEYYREAIKGNIDFGGGGGEDSRVDWMLETDVFTAPTFAYPTAEVNVDSSGTIAPVILSGSEPFTAWAVSSGTLPSEFSFDTATGVITYTTTAATDSGTFFVTASNPAGTSAEYQIDWEIRVSQGIHEFTNTLNPYPFMRISTSSTDNADYYIKTAFHGRTTGASNGTLIADATRPIYVKDNGNGTWNYLLLPTGYGYWVVFIGSSTDPSTFVDGLSTDITTSLTHDLVAPTSQDIAEGGATDYSVLEISGYFGFDGTYTRKTLPSYTLVTGDTFSGNAVWKLGGGHYMFVKDGASDTALVYSEFSSQWQLITKTGYDFVNSPTNNSNLGFVDSLSTLFIGSTAYENSIEQPTESSEFNYTVGATYYPSDRTDVHWGTGFQYIHFGNDASLDNVLTKGGNHSFGFTLVDAWPRDGMGRGLLTREGRNWVAVALGHSDTYSEMIVGNGASRTYDGSEVAPIPVNGFPAGAVVRATVSGTTLSFYVDGVKYYDYSISSYWDATSANTLDLQFSNAPSRDVHTGNYSYDHTGWQGQIERLWIANGTVVSTDDDGVTYPASTTHAWDLDEVTGNTFAPAIGSITAEGRKLAV